MSACVAACAGARVRHSGYCDDQRLLQFAQDRGGGGRRKERQAVVTRATMEAFRESGFAYLGRVRLAAAPAERRAPKRERRAADEAGPAPGGSGGSSSGASSGGGGGSSAHAHALRYTPSGDVYYARLNSTAAAAITRIAPTRPPRLRLRRSAGEVDGGGNRTAAAVAAVKQPGGARALRMIIGADERAPCGQPPAYPLTAVGQLDFVAGGLDYICSGALVRPDKVLTAAHCVWSPAEQSFVRGVGFAAGRHRAPSGAVVSPFGVQGWKHVTLVSELPSTTTPGSDLAVITLDAPVSPDAGTMGVEAGCGAADAARPQLLRTAGFASDRAAGECVTQACSVALSCDAPATAHACDTFMGQSGSPFFDARNFVRGVHVRGMASHNEFSNVNERTLQSLLL